MRSGAIRPGYGFLGNVGNYGDYRSCSGVMTYNAYNMNYNAVTVQPSIGPSNRYTGFSLRCLQEYGIFVRSGFMGIGLGFSRYVGVYGDYWSQSGATPIGAYDLSCRIPGVNSSNGPDNRFTGFSLRYLQEVECSSISLML